MKNGSPLIVDLSRKKPSSNTANGLSIRFVISGGNEKS